MKDLPPGYRTIFLLHEVEGYEHQEIAEMLSCSVGNSKSQLYKAKLRFRELLAPSPAAQLAVQNAKPCAKKRVTKERVNWNLPLGPNVVMPPAPLVA